MKSGLPARGAGAVRVGGSHTLHTRVYLALALALGGCYGQISGTGPGSEDPAVVPPGADPTMPGPAGPAATPPGTTPPGATPPGTMPPGFFEPAGTGAACAPGTRVPMHRLNATEYDNTLRDLLGVTTRFSTKLPPDSLGKTFFNDAAALASLTPEHVHQHFLVAGEIAAEALAKSRAQLVTCDPAGANREACTRQTLTRLVARAYRRPAQDAEITELLKVAARGASFDEGLGLALRAMLISPSFLYRTAGPAAAAVNQLDQYEIASRLSYFLWSTMPDDPLFEAAKSGQLGQKAGLDQQVKRMLKDPRARALVSHFAFQWLNLGRLEQFTPDAAVFPGFSAEMRADMQTETRMLFEDVIATDRPAFTWLTAGETFVNERLARLYGLSGVTGAQFRKVPLAGVPRKGFLTHSAILAATSHPNATSISRRGAWVKTNMLCQPPPPPPQDIPETPAPPGFMGTRRQLAELHRSAPACAACHALIDPMGIGLENYDVVGRYRTEENGLPIDNEGVLPDGRRFKGAMELIALLEGEPAYKRCVSEKLLTYALGREVTVADKCSVDRLATAVAGGSFSDLIAAVALSAPFQTQAGEVKP